MEICSTKLKLQELDLEISPLLETPLLNSFLLTLKNLEILRLRRFPLFNPFTENIVESFSLNLPLSTIRTLEISNTLVHSLEFLNYLPRLEALDIILRDYRNISFCEMIENTNVTEFFTPHYILKRVFIEAPLCSFTCISRLFNVITNSLTCVKLRLNDEMFWTLCESCVQMTLKELHIIAWEGLTDEGITGISHSVLSSSMHSLDLTSYRNQPYVGRLKSN